MCHTKMNRDILILLKTARGLLLTKPGKHWLLIELPKGLNSYNNYGPKLLPPHLMLESHTQCPSDASHVEILLVCPVLIIFYS